MLAGPCPSRKGSGAARSLKAILVCWPASWRTAFLCTDHGDWNVGFARLAALACGRGRHAEIRLCAGKRERHCRRAGLLIFFPSDATVASSPICRAGMSSPTGAPIPPCWWRWRPNRSMSSTSMPRPRRTPGAPCRPAGFPSFQFRPKRRFSGTHPRPRPCQRERARQSAGTRSAAGAPGAGLPQPGMRFKDGIVSLLCLPAAAANRPPIRG